MAALVQIVPTATAWFDRDFRFVAINEAGARELGTEAAKLVGQRLPDLFPEIWPRLKPAFERVLAGESLHELSVDLTEVSPGPADWTAGLCPIVRDGEIVGIAGTGFHISELRHTQHQLELRNNLYAMLASANAAMVASDDRQQLFHEICELAVETGHFKFAWIGEPSDGVIREVASAGEAGGYLSELERAGAEITTDPEDVHSQGPTGRAIVSGEASVVNDFLNSPITQPWHDAASKAGFAASAAFPIKHGDEVVAVLTLYAPEKYFFSEDLVETLSEIVPTLSVWMDWYALELEGKEFAAELMLRDRALEAANQGILITDAKAGGDPIIYVSPAFEEMTGYSKDELIGRNCRLLQGEGTDPAAIDVIRQAIHAGRDCEVELLNYRKDGEPFWNRLSLSPVHDDSGELTHFVGVQTDVTERRAIEEQVIKSQRLEAIGKLAGGIAHDFNNTLTAIRGTVDLLLADATDDAVREDLQTIDRAADHAAGLTRQLLAFSRQQVLQPVPTDLNQVVAETTGLVSRVIGEDIELVEDLGTGIENVMVDPTQLQQVIMNLALNARDAMPDGGCMRITTVACTIEPGESGRPAALEPGRFAVVTVSDDGIGMDDATRARLFEPFFTTKPEGTGLGLPTVHGIVHQSGGEITVESKLGVGTSFSVWLPTTTEAIAGAATPRKAESLSGGETVLHVEDSEMLRPLVSRVLGRQGYTVLSAENADRALELARERMGEIDLVLTDIVMPGMNGRELADILLKENPGLKIVFSSGYPEDAEIREGIAGAQVEFLEKPFLANDLLRAVRRILDQ